ncbi:MAG: Hpt domain-containing protein, partial [Bacteriovorax sp.]
MNEFEKEVKLDFLAEAIQLLDDAEQAFLALEGDKNNANLMNEIFRLAHNLKGTSRAVGFGDVAEFTHEMENLILKIKEGQIEITDAIVSLLLECNDHVSVMIKMLNMDLDSRFNSEEIIAKIHLALKGELKNAPSSVAAKEPTEEASPSAMEEEVSEGISAEDIALLEKFERDLEAPAVALTSGQKEERAQSFFPSENKPALQIVPAPAVASESVEHKKAGHAKGAAEDDTIRVSLARVEMLNNVVGE